MTCRVPDFKELIQFECNGNVKGQCTEYGCINMIQDGENAVILQIPSLSHDILNCRWRCLYGNNSAYASRFIFSK